MLMLLCFSCWLESIELFYLLSQGKMNNVVFTCSHIFRGISYLNCLMVWKDEPILLQNQVVFTSTKKPWATTKTLHNQLLVRGWFAEALESWIDNWLSFNQCKQSNHTWTLVKTLKTNWLLSNKTTWLILIEYIVQPCHVDFIHDQIETWSKSNNVHDSFCFNSHALKNWNCFDCLLCMIKM